MSCTRKTLWPTIGTGLPAGIRSHSMSGSASSSSGGLWLSDSDSGSDVFSTGSSSGSGGSRSSSSPDTDVSRLPSKSTNANAGTTTSSVSCPICGKVLDSLPTSQRNAHVARCLDDPTPVFNTNSRATVSVNSNTNDSNNNGMVLAKAASTGPHRPSSFIVDPPPLQGASPFGLECPYAGCGKTYEASDFTAHARAMHSNVPQGYACPLCSLLGLNYSVNAQTNLINHLQHGHADLWHIATTAPVRHPANIASKPNTNTSNTNTNNTSVRTGSNVRSIASEPSFIKLRSAPPPPPPVAQYAIAALNSPSPNINKFEAKVEKKPRGSDSKASKSPKKMHSSDTNVEKDKSTRAKPSKDESHEKKKVKKPSSEASTSDSPHKKERKSSDHPKHTSPDKPNQDPQLRPDAKKKPSHSSMLKAEPKESSSTHKSRSTRRHSSPIVSQPLEDRSMISSAPSTTNTTPSASTPASPSPSGPLMTTPTVSASGDYLISTCLHDLDQECGICYDEFEKGTVVARLGCFCLYHKNCIEMWFSKKGKHSCPLHIDEETPK